MFGIFFVPADRYNIVRLTSGRARCFYSQYSADVPAIPSRNVADAAPDATVSVLIETRALSPDRNERVHSGYARDCIYYYYWNKRTRRTRLYTQNPPLVVVSVPVVTHLWVSPEVHACFFFTEYTEKSLDAHIHILIARSRFQNW